MERGQEGISVGLNVLGSPRRVDTADVASTPEHAARLGPSQYRKDKILSHPAKVESFVNGVVAPPVYVRIKPTNVCDHACFYCTYADREEGGGPSFSRLHETTRIKDQIPRGKMAEVLADFRDMGVRAVTYSGGGEPTIYPFIQETLERTLEYGIDLSMITHGQHLMESRVQPLRHAKWVRISQDATTAETFEKIRRKGRERFDAIRKSAAEFARVKDQTCELEVNFVVSELNFGEIYEGARMWREIGANNIRFSPVWNPDFVNYHGPIRREAEEQIARARAEFDEGEGGFRVFDTYGIDFTSCGLPVRPYNRCYVMQTTPAIGADCGVYFCHNKAYSPTGMLGSIKERSFRDLWFSEEAAKIFRDFDPQQGCPHQCAGDLQNIVVNGLMKKSAQEVSALLEERASKGLLPGVNFV